MHPISGPDGACGDDPIAVPVHHNDRNEHCHHYRHLGHSLWSLNILYNEESDLA